ncbi:HTH domain-containing protein [Nocardioides albertanoniae]|uniref:HTH domain-containing protein n=1 Tax=Nocardioides albertanoniae TaxID=1175486 RepID=A0A543ADB1_9ACTN|nr:helix-turn-helix domain-containing protein [Nocardioides albertanoniae]TQL70567.1 HTH domain-containing protein [Nocardioides albertanoniae]
MRVEAEFTTEPFRGEGEPPEHATAALQAAREAGLECDFGPLGTSIRGEREAVLGALSSVAAAGLDHGADQITFQVRLEGHAAPRRTANGLEALLAEVAEGLGADLKTLDRPGKQRAVRLLEERGAFEFRKSAEIVAEALGVTRFTVYNYLNRERG